MLNTFAGHLLDRVNTL